MDAPVLLIIFNRPETTKQVFEAIRRAQPKQLFIAADGPRADRPGEHGLCEEARKIATAVDWDCEVKTLFREENKGCGRAPAEAISWFFENVEQGIILEDDCVPNKSFFEFCRVLLMKHADEEKIMMISGCSFQKETYDEYSYYYSRYVHIWGWATWRRAWNFYNLKPDRVRVVNSTKSLENIFKKKQERKLWIKNVLYAIDTMHIWDYQWMYAIWKNDGFTIVPWKNLVSNIGFGKDATHTKGFEINTMALPTYELDFIKHPAQLLSNKKADEYIRYKLIINKVNVFTIINKLKRIIYRLRSLKK